jgi:hypothetical protein
MAPLPHRMHVQVGCRIQGVLRGDCTARAATGRAPGDGGHHRAGPGGVAAACGCWRAAAPLAGPAPTPGARFMPAGTGHHSCQLIPVACSGSRALSFAGHPSRVQKSVHELDASAGCHQNRRRLTLVARAQAHAFEARLYAESPERNFMPGVGTIQRWRTPLGAVAFSHEGSVRVDSGVQEGDQACSACSL